MKVENIKVDQNKSVLSEEAILLLRKLIMMLAPISTNTSMVVRVNTTGSSNMDGVGVATNYGAATLPNITTINQLGGSGLSIPQGSINTIDSIPFSGGWGHKVGDIITLSGGSTVVVNGVYDKNILTINKIPISGGIGYVGGEIITLINEQGNGRNGTVIASSVDIYGSIVEVQIVDTGYDYSVGYSYQLNTTGNGTGLIVDITSILIGGGRANSVSILNTGTNYSIGNYRQISTTGSGSDLVVSVISVDGGYGNSNFLQIDNNRWLYTDMIRNQINF